jgi:SRSO17 transposase
VAQKENFNHPQRMENIWGLSIEIIEELGNDLLSFYEGFNPLFKTKTRDVSHHGLTGLKGSLLMDGKRTYMEVSRKIVHPLDDGQNYQHFMSDSPWESQPIFDEIQGQIRGRFPGAGSMLNIDESGDECSSSNKAGAQKQYIGRLGKTEVGQVGVVSSWYREGVWVLTDAELFLPESWFTEEKQRIWKRLHIPADREFGRKIDLAQAQIDHAIENQLPFDVVGADTFYGRDGGFRDHVATQGKHYMVSIPCDLPVWEEEPVIGIPEKRPGQRGPAYKNEQVLMPVAPIQVRELRKEVAFETVYVRDCERGRLMYEHAFAEVWTVREEQRYDEMGNSYKGLRPVKELLVIRKEKTGKYSYSLSNAPMSTDKRTLAQWKANRHFVERTIQDTKTEAGWDDLQSSKYRAYMHTLAIDALALWFVAQTKLKMRSRCADSETITQQLGIHRVPDLSFANVRELLRQVFPLKTLSKSQAIELVTRHLVNRTKSTKSRLKGTKIQI